MAMDLEKKSRQELETLRADVEKALTSVDTRRRAEARAAAEKAAREHGFSLDDVIGADKKKKSSPAKFRNIADPRMTWTGRGRQPKWIKEALEKGQSLDEFKI